MEHFDIVLENGDLCDYKSLGITRHTLGTECNRRRGRALLELIASRRLATAADLDLTPIEEACRRHLAGEGTALDPLMSKFVARVLERG